MMTLGSRARVAIVTSMVVGWAFLAYACTSEDENPATDRVKVDSGTGDGSVDPLGTDASLGAPICGDYGGYANVKTIAGAVLTKVSADCRINSPIANLNAESAQHLKECFEIQLGSAFQCPGITYVSGTTKDTAGKACRDMGSAHKNMKLRKADFNAFQDDVIASLTEANLTPAHVKSIAAFVEGTRGLVTQENTQPDKNTYCACPNGEFPAGSGKSCVVDGGPQDAGTDALDAGADG